MFIQTINAAPVSIDVLESEKNENEEGDFDDVFDIWQDPWTSFLSGIGIFYAPSYLFLK